LLHVDLGNLELEVEDFDVVAAAVHHLEGEYVSAALGRPRPGVDACLDEKALNHPSEPDGAEMAASAGKPLELLRGQYDPMILAHGFAPSADLASAMR